MDSSRLNWQLSYVRRRRSVKIGDAPSRTFSALCTNVWSMRNRVVGRSVTVISALVASARKASRCGGGSWLTPVPQEYEPDKPRPLCQSVPAEAMGAAEVKGTTRENC